MNKHIGLLSEVISKSHFVNLMVDELVRLQYVNSLRNLLYTVGEAILKRDVIIRDDYDISFYSFNKLNSNYFENLSLINTISYLNILISSIKSDLFSFVDSDKFKTMICVILDLADYIEVPLEDIIN